MAPMLSEERWRLLETLFQDVLDCHAAGRQALIEARTAGDPDLRRHLEEMLAHSGEAAGRIARSIGTLAQLAATGGDWTGRRVGPYRLTREIGRGGMGIVFEASRDDAEYRKTVALKILPAWRDQPGLRERFRNERQILAGLDHPNIARFLDGGTEDGIPYFVMEYVDGMSLSDWRRQRQPGVRESLALFRQICEAVHCAHENLVVHRDLKPANILVNRDGVPKLLDFGIAKLLAPLPGESGVTTETRQWTPDYTSPEQVRGGAVTTRTDVYSLGLILYELLCGERAQTADPSSPLALDRSICEVDPPLPGVRAAAAGNFALARQLRGDLDTIVAMAVSKDPQRRYSSAAALNADIERYLDGRPVSARPATLAYRAGKLLRRHRLAFAAAALVAGTAIAGVTATVHQARRAERRFQEVRSLAGAFVFDVHDRIQYLPGATEARKTIVATGLRYLESLSRDAAGDPSLALELAAAYQRIGDTQGRPLTASLHDTEGAMASYHAAHNLLKPLFQKQDPRAQLPMAHLEFSLALIEYAQGHGQAAAESLERARTIVRPLMDRPAIQIEALTLAGDIGAEMTRNASERHEPAKARAAAQETVEIGRRLTALQPSSVESLDLLGVAQSSLGTAYRSEGDLENAARSYRDSAATREQLVLREPQNTGYRRTLMLSYGHLGDCLGSPRGGGLGDLDDAAKALARTVEIAQSLARQDPADRTARNDLANATYRAGDVLLLQPGRAAEALPLLEEGERLLLSVIKEDPLNERSKYNLVFVQRRTAEALEALGRDAEAVRKLVAARNLAETFAGTKEAANARAGFAVAGINLARIKARSGDPSALALANATAAEIPSLPLHLSGTSWGEAMVYADMGRVFLQLRKKDSAAYWLQKSAGVWREMKVVPPLEAQRAAQLASVEASLAKAR